MKFDCYLPSRDLDDAQAPQSLDRGWLVARIKGAVAQLPPTAKHQKSTVFLFSLHKINPTAA